jgi:hypothetical protein
MLMLGEPIDNDEEGVVELFDLPFPAIATPMPAPAATARRINHFAFPLRCTDSPGDALVTDTEGSVLSVVAFAGAE